MSKGSESLTLPTPLLDNVREYIKDELGWASFKEFCREANRLAWTAPGEGGNSDSMEHQTISLVDSKHCARCGARDRRIVKFVQEVAL